MRAAACLILGASFLAAQRNDLAEKSKRGKELMATGRFEEAIPIYRDLAKALPDGPGPAMDLGLALHMAGHGPEAVTQFQKVLRLEPSNVPARLFLGAAYLGLKNPAKAVEPLRGVVRAEPRNADGHLLLGDALLSLEHYREASQQYEKLSQLEAGNPKAWNGLGQSYEGLARQSFDQLEKAAPDSAYWLDLVAESRAKGDEFKGAYFFYREALKKMPELRGVHTALGDIYRKTGHADWAEIEEKKEANLPPLNCRKDPAFDHKVAPSLGSRTGPDISNKPSALLECDFWAARYQELIDASRGDKSVEADYWRTRALNELAKQAFSRLAELPPSGEVYELLAKIEFSQRKYTQAANEWQQALKFSPDSSFDRQGLAISSSAAGDYENAYVLLKDLIKESPDSQELNYWLGYCLLGLEKPSDAVPYLERAVRIDSAPLEPHRDLARAYLRVGEIDKALPHAKAAFPIDADGTLYYQLAQAFRKTGQKESEMEMLAKFRDIQNSSAAEKKRLEEEIQITPP